ncbi:YheC/YheD family endospore coat-associated protein [Tepidibacillus decaturensis]|uniref:ATP-grasp domain-containing protein n=1 Tax=Tepidibacillus decaturensis TaxID=1413211 RepID=A0A135L1F7_9BACI|nr:YheC/YheD family protein [Tepidibacillus decaturensis]KXG42810.1 hypothetical protein U473_01250 [Tepidibacillus decaturensis]
MTVLAIQVEEHEIKNNIIYVNPTLISQLNLPLQKPFSISFGNKKTEVMVRVSSNFGHLLRIPSSIATELLIPNGLQIHARYDTAEGLKLGPILGILVQHIDSSHPQAPFGKLTTFCEEISMVSKSKGLLTYVFTMKDINKQTQSVTGWVLKDKHWLKHIFPIPNVVYNRISSRNIEKSLKESITNLKQQYHLHFFNEHFLNKWQVYEILKPTPIHSMMPETRYYKGILTIKEMLVKYPILYLKPTNGALGRGIIRIEKQNNHLFIVQYSRSQGSITHTFHSIGQMFKHLQPRLNTEPYLVQQGLPLIQIEKRPIDFRILTQKNKYGKWAITSMVARIASDQHFVSNLARGGTQSGVMKTIRLSDSVKDKKISKQRFRTLALAIAQHLEESSTGNFAEFGIDLALDTNGNVWLLEVNSKPSKTEESQLNEPRPSVMQLLKYVLFVSGFKNHLKTKIGKKRLKSGGNQ